MEVKFRTLTPIFTGDRFTNQSPQLRETGIIGSLRFWAGAIARGMGLEVKSPKDIKVESMHDVEKLDPVNLVFGCTGWKRIFNLNFDEYLPHNFGHNAGSLHLQTSTSPKMSWKGWYLKPGFLVPWNDDPITARILFRSDSVRFKKWTENLLGASWAIISGLGGIGAHQGWGYGQIRMENSVDEKIGEFAKHVKVESHQHNTGFPDLADFVFAEYQFKEVYPNVRIEALNSRPRTQLFKDDKAWKWPANGMTPALLKDPVGLVLRYLLQNKDSRYRASSIAGWDTARDSKFFGGSKDGDPAGRFHASYLYRVDSQGEPDPNGDYVRFRMWAWLPKNRFPNWCNDANTLYNQLRDTALWKATANCNPPDNCYFWPLTRAHTKKALKALSPILNLIENRAANMLGRKCV